MAESGSWLDYALSKPGAWQDEPWEGDVVTKVSDKTSRSSDPATVQRSDSSAAGTATRRTS